MAADALGAAVAADGDETLAAALAAGDGAAAHVLRARPTLTTALWSTDRCVLAGDEDGALYVWGWDGALHGFSGQLPRRASRTTPLRPTGDPRDDDPGAPEEEGGPGGGGAAAAAAAAAGGARKDDDSKSDDDDDDDEDDDDDDEDEDDVWTASPQRDHPWQQVPRATREERATEACLRMTRRAHLVERPLGHSTDTVCFKLFSWDADPASREGRYRAPPAGGSSDDDGDDSDGGGSAVAAAGGGGAGGGDEPPAVWQGFRTVALSAAEDGMLILWAWDEENETFATWGPNRHYAPRELAIFSMNHESFDFDRDGGVDIMNAEMNHRYIVTCAHVSALHVRNWNFEMLHRITTDSWVRGLSWANIGEDGAENAIGAYAGIVGSDDSGYVYAWNIEQMGSSNDGQVWKTRVCRDYVRTATASDTHVICGTDERTFHVLSLRDGKEDTPGDKSANGWCYATTATNCTVVGLCSGGECRIFSTTDEDGVTPLFGAQLQKRADANFRSVTAHPFGPRIALGDNAQVVIHGRQVLMKSAAKR